MSLKLVVVGASGHLNYVIDHLPRFPQIQLKAYSPSYAGEDMSRLAVLGTGICAYDDWRRMLDAERPDVVVACGRLDVNGLVSLDALERGCHVISEKPSALTLEQIAAIGEAVATRSQVYALMLAMRYEPTYYTAHELVAQGLIGTPYMITAQKSYRWGASRPEWYADPAKYGSTMAWVGIHAFDFARWVSGVGYAEVAAYHANRLHPDRPGCQDVATVIARLANGGTAAFNLDFMRPDGAPTHGDDRLRVAGPSGIIEVCDQGTRLHVTTRDRDVRDWPLSFVSRSLLGDVVGSIEGTGDLLVTPEEALSISGFALRAAIAADTGRPVAIPYADRALRPHRLL